jgi:hypothetical protein
MGGRKKMKNWFMLKKEKYEKLLLMCILRKGLQGIRLFIEVKIKYIRSANISKLYFMQTKFSLFCVTLQVICGTFVGVNLWGKFEI